MNAKMDGVLFRFERDLLSKGIDDRIVFIVHTILVGRVEEIWDKIKADNPDALYQIITILTVRGIKKIKEVDEGAALNALHFIAKLNKGKNMGDIILPLIEWDRGVMVLQAEYLDALDIKVCKRVRKVIQFIRQALWGAFWAGVIVVGVRLTNAIL